jgi:quercetin dioxygenase-like cupin family protein
MTIKAGADATGGTLTVMEQVMPPGFAAPPHVHHAEDEPWYVLEGRVRFFCQDQVFEAEPGAFVFLPKDIVHSFRVDESAAARMLLMGVPGGVERFFAAAGEPALERTIPPAPGPAELDRVRSLARDYGIDILGGPTPR